MNQERPSCDERSALSFDRRTGPADRRQSDRRGGRRSTDIAATSLVLSAMLLTGCGTSESFSPIAPGATSGDVRTQSEAPASPAEIVVEDKGGEQTDHEDEDEVDSEPEAEADPNTERDAAPLALQPLTVALSAGASQQFSVNGAKGTVVWKATGGTITSKGLYRAGAKAGTFTVTASTTSQAAKTANVTIKVTGAPPPAGGGGTSDGGTTNDGGGTTVTGTVINPGANIQSAINANPEGTTFTIKAGVHRRQSFRPKSGMKFIGEPGAVLDGENVTPQAIVAHDARNVTVRGLRITNYAPPNLGGALDGVGSHGWVVENTEIDHNSNGSARTYGLFVGSDWIVRNNKVHHNGWIGITGWECTGTLIDDNEVYANPATIFTDTVGDTGNMKFYGCGDMVVRNNYVHDSPRFGIWFDRSRPGVTIENNRVLNHGEAGIWYEVSYRGTIRGNRVDNAGTRSYYSSGWLRGGGIQVTNSPDVTVVNNTVTNSLNGIIGLQADGYYHGKYGNSELRNFLVQNNTVVMPKGQTGIASTSGNAVYDTWNNRFSGNTYTTSGSTPFQWKGSNLTAAQWKAGPGSADSF